MHDVKRMGSENRLNQKQEASAVEETTLPWYEEEIPIDFGMDTEQSLPEKKGIYHTTK
jgi:hypothetical protein